MAPMINMVERDSKCWICLSSGDEYPPMGTLKDARDWVYPCSCSLVAHRKCLLEWVSRNNLEYKNEVLSELNSDGSTIGFESLNVSDAYSSVHSRIGSFNPLNWLGIRRSSSLDGRLSFNPAEISKVLSSVANDAIVRNVTDAMTAGAQEPLPIGPSLRGSRKLVINTVCPQCNSPILLKTSGGLTIPLSIITSKAFTWFAKASTQTTIIGTIGGSILFSCGCLLTSWGLRVLTTLAPESTLLKLLDLPKASNLYQALQKNQVGFKQVLLMGLAPIFLLSFRFENKFLGWPKRLYPILFLRPGESLHMNVKRFLLLLYPLSILNDFIQLVVYNPLYFKWVHRVKPYFLCDRMSLEQLRLYEAEQEYIETKREAERISPPPNGFLSKFLSFFRRKTTEEPLIQGINTRRFLMATTFDYSQALVETSPWEKITSTMLWPVSGKLFHTFILSKFSWFRSTTAQQTATPDDALFLGNLIGCCAVAILKDLVHLFVTWRRVKQLQSMEVIERMSPEWEYTLNRKTGQVLSQLGLLTEDEESSAILEEHINTMLPKLYQEQWVNVSSSIPTMAGKVNFFRYLVMKMSIERSATYQLSRR
ncbi:LADA_0F12882g1_1 [Lachancea dasiensis]|uniref:LADA_0F12882g1_1 n=1 Tax=Lachancea dasiensis TaxID=1072105 RepID=A0A1G4JMK9_9SACH|nr:LADA_0F12882g1_1 [Lachancea dasiensis]